MAEEVTVRGVDVKVRGPWISFLLAIVTLGYLGLGVPPPNPDWGRMIYEGQQFITTHYLLATVPGLVVVLTGIGLALVGDGLADLLRVE